MARFLFCLRLALADTYKLQQASDNIVKLLFLKHSRIKRVRINFQDP